MSQEIFGPVYKEIFPFWNEIPKGDRDYICDNSRSFLYPGGKRSMTGMNALVSSLSAQAVSEFI